MTTSASRRVVDLDSLTDEDDEEEAVVVAIAKWSAEAPGREDADKSAVIRSRLRLDSDERRRLSELRDEAAQQRVQAVPIIGVRDGELVEDRGVVWMAKRECR